MDHFRWQLRLARSDWVQHPGLWWRGAELHGTVHGEQSWRLWVKLLFCSYLQMQNDDWYTMCKLVGKSGEWRLRKLRLRRRTDRLLLLAGVCLWFVDVCVYILLACDDTNPIAGWHHTKGLYQWRVSQVCKSRHWRINGRLTVLQKSGFSVFYH